MKIPWIDLYKAIMFKNDLLLECFGIEWTAQQALDELDQDIADNFY